MRDLFEARVFHAENGERIPYRLFKPQGRAPDQQCPLVVYLHGSAGRGRDNLKQISGGNVYGSRVWAPPENQAARPCFVLAPQLLQGVSGRREMAVQGKKVTDAPSGSPVAGKWKQVATRPWGEMVMELTIRDRDGSLEGSLRIPRRGTLAVENVSCEDGRLSYTTRGALSLEGQFTMEGRRFTGTLATVGNRERAATLKALIRSVVEEFGIDEDRIYITGQSMGGAGTWGMLGYYPKVFAAAAPVCGAGDADSAQAIAEGGTAVWAFHGAADPAVPVEASRRMTAALRAAGGHPKYTEYPGVKHDSWVDAYPDPALHHWMFQQTQGRRP
jgi:predicted peptidase